jgi:PAS domain S-box-containing protein
MGTAVLPQPARLGFDLIREAFDQSAVGLVVVTLEGQFVEVNRAFCDLLGYPREEIEGQGFRRFTHPDDAARDEEHLRGVREGATLPAVEKRLVRRSGQEVWVRRSAAVLRDASG